MKTSKKARRSRKSRKGVMMAITAVLLMAILGMVACALDIGWIEMTRTQLQAASDASSLAAGTELMPGLGFFKTKTPAQIVTAATPVAEEYAGYNRNAERDSSFIEGGRDVTFGKAAFDDGCACWKKTPSTENPEYYNYVEVDTLRNQVGSGAGDGPTPLFFARIFGFNEKSLQATSTAAILASNGFRVTDDGDTAPVMPFAFNELLWDRMQRAQDYLNAHPGLNLNNWDTLKTIDDPDYPGEPLFGATSGSGKVQLYYDNYNRTDAGGVSQTADGLLETNIYPMTLTVGGSSAGNSGTVDLGDPDNDTEELRRKITEGLNAHDLSYYENNVITLSEENPLDEGANPGISAGVKSALDEVIGDCKAIVLYSALTGVGNEGTYTLTRFVSATVVKVNLTGGNKELRIQRCLLVDNSGVPDTEHEIDDETTIFTPINLIR